MGKKRKFFETDNFKCLQSMWYGKLKELGFDDHEKLIGDTLVLMQASPYSYRYRRCNSSSLREASRLLREARLQYYFFLSQRVFEEDFDSDRDKIIMLLRSQGKKIVEIVLRLKEFGYYIHRQTVRFIIRKFEHKWGIRTWQKKQMTSNPVTA